jgi:hypothetical protein
MTEPTSQPAPEAPFADDQLSRFLIFGNEIQLPGDPATAADFARGLHYLEAITDHLLASGSWWEKTACDVADALCYHNDWHHYEVEQERKAGIIEAEYRAISAHNLRALSKRRVLALEENGWSVTFAYRIVCFVDRLIAEAAADEEERERLLNLPGVRTASDAGGGASDDVPF